MGRGLLLSCSFLDIPAPIQTTGMGRTNGKTQKSSIFHGKTELGLNEPDGMVARRPPVRMGYLDDPKQPQQRYLVRTDGYVLADGLTARPSGGRRCRCDGRSNNYSGEVPRVCVVLKGQKGGSKGLEKEPMKKYVQGRKVRHKWITGGCMFGSKIPKPASGMLLRRVLRARSRRADKSASTEVEGEVEGKAKL